MSNPIRPIYYPELKSRGVKFTRVHLARLEKAGLFPRRIKLSPNTVCWDANEIDAYLEARAAARDQKVA